MRRPLINVYVDNVLVPTAHEVRTLHDVDQPIGTGSVVIDAPGPKVAELAAPIRVEAGYDGEGMATIFDGRVANDSSSFGEPGGQLRIEMEGWGKLLWYPNTTDQSLPGPITPTAIFNAFAADRGVPVFFADESTNPDGSSLVFGGISQVDGGNVVIKADESPGEKIDRLGRIGGYRAFDIPRGEHRFQKVSGLPEGFWGDFYETYSEGLNVFDVRRSQTLNGMANYWDVYGAKYTQGDGSQLAVRSFPLSYTPDDRLGPHGVNRRRENFPDLLTNARADHARNVLEIDRSTPIIRYAWTTEFDPWVQPGLTALVMSPTIHGYENPEIVDQIIALIPRPMWIMSVQHSLGMDVWTTTIEGWAGAGTALPAGNDCTVQQILGPEGRHFGNEYLWHYRRPNPDGLTIKIPFVVADDYSTLTIRGIGHGCNSFVRNQESEATRFEIWQDRGSGLERVASGDIQSLKENLERRYPYGEQSAGVYTNRFWEPIVVPLSGNLTAGAAEFRIISGRDSEIGDYDDGEVANLVLETCGIGVPEVPV